MQLQIHHISPHLQPYVKLICTMECNEDSDTQHIRVLPDTCVELFLNYTSTPVAIIGNELYQHSIATFRMSRPMDVQMRKGSGCLAICFHPGMAYHFFDIPMDTLSDTTVELYDIWQNLVFELEEKLAETNNNSSRIAIAQNFLISLLQENKPHTQVAYCLAKIELSGSTSVMVNQLVDETGISQRHLSRKFQQQVGLSPKEYLRANRFINSLRYLQKHPSISLTEIAYKSGYYDQAHFIRDYKVYTGHTPREILNSQHILY